MLAKQLYSLSSLMVMGVFAGGVPAATITVDINGGADFTAVGEAVNAAFANQEADEILVAPGTYVFNANFGETLSFIGEDEIVVRGSDPNDPPVIPVEPNFDVGGETLDGVVIQMGGSLTLENLIFIPSETFSIEASVDDLIAVVNAGTADAPQLLDLTLTDVVITHGTLDNVPATTSGFNDPRLALNGFRDDGLNVSVDDDEVNLTLNGVVISGYGTETGSDALVLDGSNINAAINEGSRFTFLRRRGIFAFNLNTLTINGTDDKPVIVYGANETLARASGGEHNWSHLWGIGVQEGDGDQAINTGWALRVDPNGGAVLNLDHCLFSTTVNDGGFMNFDSEVPIAYQFSSCTFHNVPAMMRFGFVGEPGPSENVSLTVTDSIIDNADWTAPNDGTFFAPEPTVIDFGDGDNTLAQVTLQHVGYRAQTLVSSRSGSRQITTTRVIEVDNFQFASTEFNPNDFSNFLVATNCADLGSAGTNETPLGGARPTPCATAVNLWFLQ